MRHCGLITTLYTIMPSPDEDACRGNLTDDLNIYNPLTKSTMAAANWPVMETWDALKNYGFYHMGIAKKSADCSHW